MTDTPTFDSDRAGRLRRRLADQLLAGGWLRSPQWKAAVEAVPRHHFIPAFYKHLDTPKQTLWEPVTADRAGVETWLEMAYQNTTWVTQLDNKNTEWRTATEAVDGEPTSSSSLPSLVIEMLEALDIQDGMNVLEIGTGTGYSTALLCHRLGSEHVSSIEVDPGLALQARTALHSVGYHPTLVNGDGLDGYQDRAPYDRVIATCAVRAIPQAWISQTRPGGSILATLSGWQYGSALAHLEVAEPGYAQGRFLPGTISFMLARSQTTPAAPNLPDLLRTPGDRRPTVLGPDILSDWTALFVAQLAVPDAIRQQLTYGDSRTVDVFVNPTTGAFAELTRQNNQDWTVRQTGSPRIWDAIEYAITSWQAAGSPWIDQFTLYVTPGKQEVVISTNDTTACWTLPTSR